MKIEKYISEPSVLKPKSLFHILFFKDSMTTSCQDLQKLKGRWKLMTLIDNERNHKISYKSSACVWEIDSELKLVRIHNSELNSTDQFKHLPMLKGIYHFSINRHEKILSIQSSDWYYRKKKFEYRITQNNRLILRMRVIYKNRSRQLLSIILRKQNLS